MKDHWKTSNKLYIIGNDGFIMDSTISCINMHDSVNCAHKGLCMHSNYIIILSNTIIYTSNTMYMHVKIVTI